MVYSTKKKILEASHFIHLPSGQKSAGRGGPALPDVGKEKERAQVLLQSRVAINSHFLKRYIHCLMMLLK